ncbi:hypothetical protein [Thermofilum sp.]|uniref:hypothetical protein n=1 Tax=Thermofilum sp. TaxID=1961369 RepID=UPI0031701228
MPKIRLTKHGATHAFGGSDPIPLYSLDATQIRSLGTINVSTVGPLTGTGGQYGPPSPIFAMDPNRVLVPLAATLTWQGTFSAGETVTIMITARYHDRSISSITRSATAPGSITLDTADLSRLYTHDKFITRIDVAAASSAPSTSVNTIVTVYSLEIYLGQLPQVVY